MEFKDYYQALGVARNADADAIRSAYRKLARKYHPDVSKEPDAQARMQEVNEAYAVLSDAGKRAAYDKLSQRQRAGQSFEPPPDWDADFGSFGDGPQPQDFSEFFETLFSRGARARRASPGDMPPMQGEDQHAQIEIDLADTYQGGERTITLRAPRRDASGRTVMDERTLHVRLPKGIREGQQVRLAGQGRPGFNGGPPGDLFLEVHFSPDPRYRIDGADVTQTLRVSPWEAMLGERIEVDTPSGRVQVAVPAHSQNGRKLRLKGRGIPGSPAGDLYLEISIVLPPDSPKARELFETMRRELDFDPRQSAEG
jgi:curved DNA-binding protein